MNVAIIGYGYVGSTLGRILADAGHGVWAVRRSPLSPAPGIHVLRADLLNPETLQWPDAIDTVVYAVSADASTEAAYRDAYVTGLRNVLQSLHGHALRRFLFISSTGVYHQDNGEWLDESSPTAPPRFSGKLLLEGEALLNASGVPSVVLRLSGIYGPGRDRLVRSVREGIATLTRGSKAVLNHIHRDDCAGLAAHLLQLPEVEPLYLGTDCEPVYKNDALQWIAAQLGMAPLPETDAEPEAGLHRGGHRFYSNKRALASGYVFKYPTFREGYMELL